MHVYLLGLNHKYQLEGYDSGGKKFQPFLNMVCQDNYVDLIAEELNEEAISLWKASGSVAKNVAVNLGVRHLFCDPDSDQRHMLGIKSRKEIINELDYGKALTKAQSEEVDAKEISYREIRERHWINELMEQECQKCIFILGADHIESLSRLLEEKGIKVEVIEKDWKS